MTDKSFPNQIEKALSPDKDELLKAELAAPSQENVLKERASVDARKCMNVMSIIGSSLLAVSSESSVKKENFTKVLDYAYNLAHKILLRWKINPDEKTNKWMLNVLVKSLMPYLSLNVKEANKELDIDYLAEKLSKNAFSYEESFSYQKDEVVYLRVFEGLVLLSKARDNFDFGRKNHLENDMVEMKNRVISSSLNIMNNLCPKLTPHEDRVVFFSMILKQSFFIMESSWNKNATLAKNVLHGLNSEQLKKWKKANPDGFSLKPVFDMYDSNINRLSKLTLIFEKQK